MGAVLHRKWKAAVSFFSRVSEKQEDGSSLCGPKASSVLSLSATLVALALCLSLKKFSNLFHCCSFWPVGISYSCPSPVTDQDKSRGGPTQNPRETKSPSPRALSRRRVLQALCSAASLPKAWFARSGEDASPSSRAKCSSTCTSSDTSLQWPAAPFATCHQGVNLCLARLGRGPFPKLQQACPKALLWRECAL